ncbi:ABC transporter permease subunit [Cardiobacteriaceae bacterium TAE3-ERU3]|nr:ABC transporter permease subunit [Cardiobacteriaceae bacterium TAE3-ERU3]
MRLLANIFRLLIAGFILITLWLVWDYSPSTTSFSDLWHDPWTRHIVTFSLEQSILSTLLSIIFAIPLIWAAYRGRWKILRHLLPITTIMPTLIFILALLQISVTITSWLGSSWRLNGFHGIIIAHVALNAPLIALLTLPAVDAIPEHYQRQRRILRVSVLTYFTRVVIPLTRPALMHATGLVFMLCFTSFTVLLVLGGSPRNANLELAIYQAVKYEFNLPQAAQLAIVQTVMLLAFLAILPNKNPPQHHTSHATPRPSRLANIAEPLLIALICLPLLVLIINTIHHFNPDPPTALWQALGNSLWLCSGVALTATSLHILFAKTATLNPRISTISQHLINAIYLAPVLILCLGLFLLLRPVTNAFRHPMTLNILMLIVLIQPYLYKLAYPTWAAHAARTQRLARTLHLKPWQQLIHIDLPALAPLLGKVCGFAAIITLGDVAVISFFGNNRFQTLASYLVAELGHYRQAQAWQTTGILLITGLALFLIPQILVRLWQKIR